MFTARHATADVNMPPPKSTTKSYKHIKSVQNAMQIPIITQQTEPLNFIKTKPNAAKSISKSQCQQQTQQ
jgi:hypothetical protein